MNNLCDKCGQPVERKDDAVRLDVEAGYSKPPALLFARPRHIMCSPSRAQYVLQLGVIDSRPDYDKRLLDPAACANLERRYTEAYERLQNEA